MEVNVKFGVFADLHVDIMHDTQKRLENFLAACRKENVDFIIQLGDFCYPETRKCLCKPEHRPINIENALNVKTYANKDRIRELYKNFEKPSYHTIGNHDCDMCSKRDILNYYESDYETYYSFDMGGFHFVVIDGNYYKMGDEYISYENGNYFDCPFEGGSLPWLPPEQLKWFEEDLLKAKYPTVMFSHQRLTAGDASIRNADILRRIIRDAPHGVVMALNGHEHIDEVQKVDDTWFYNVNSMSCYWVDTKYEVKERYGIEIDEKYPNIRYVIPYRDAVYSIVNLNQNGAEIKGVHSSEVGVSAIELGLGKNGSSNGKNLREEITASSQNRYLPFK